MGRTEGRHSRFRGQKTSGRRHIRFVFVKRSAASSTGDSFFFSFFSRSSFLRLVTVLGARGRGMEWQRLGKETERARLPGGRERRIRQRRAGPFHA